MKVEILFQIIKYQYKKNFRLQETENFQFKSKTSKDNNQNKSKQALKTNLNSRKK
jgi:hypothetical protein